MKLESNAKFCGAGALIAASLPALSGCNPAENEAPAVPAPAAVQEISFPPAPESAALKDIPRDGLLFVRMPISLLSPDFIERTGFVRDHTNDPRGHYAFGYIDSERYAELPAVERVLTIPLDQQAWRHYYYDRSTLRRVVQPGELGAKAAFEDYHNYQALQAEMKRLAAAYPEIAHLRSAGKSVEGRELYYMRISDNPQAEEHEPKLLYIANMHGDEVVGREMMIYLIRHLLEEYKEGGRFKDLIDNSQIYIMPTMNPDGFEAHQRYTARNVDLNRDFPDFTCDPHDTPHGRAPETQHIMKLHGENHFQLALNFHGGALCVNLSWDTRPNTVLAERFGDDGLQRKIGREYTQINSSMQDVHGGSFDRGMTYGYEWYEVDGGMQDWANHWRGSNHAVVELSEVKWPHPSTLPGFWEDNREALITYLERGMRGLHVEVVDTEGNAVQGVSVVMAGTGREIKYPGNRIHRVTSEGEHEALIKAPGYEPLQIKLTAKEFRGEFEKVELRRAP